MALNLYTGQPGAGKTYSVVAHVIIPALKKGRHVVTNIPLEDELLVQVFGGQITQLPHDALDDPDLPDNIPHGCVAVVDECWNRWPSGQRVSKAPKGDLHWLKEHRHRVDDKGNSMQVVLVTQDPSDLASWVRKLIKHTFWMEKLDTLGADNSFTVKIYKGCPTGENIPRRYLIRQSVGQYDPSVYQYYQSATQSAIFDVGDEAVMDRRTSIWRSPGMIAQMVLSPLAFVGACFWLYHTAIEVSGDDQLASDQEVVAQTEPSSLVNPPPQFHPQPVADPAPAVVISSLPPSGLWRVVGYIHPGTDGDQSARTFTQSWAVLATQTGAVRRVPLTRCHPYEDGVNWSCDIDGERITPWSGQMGLTNTLPGVSVSGVRSVAAERSESATTATPVRSADIALSL